MPSRLVHHWDILHCLGTSLAIMYLVLGLVTVILFIMVHQGEYVDLSPGLLIILLIIIFIGFLCSIGLIAGSVADNIFCLLPWLVFHLLCVILLCIGSTGLFFSFIFNLQLYLRAALCCVPLLTGFMLLFVWMKVYQEMLVMRARADTRKNVFKKTIYYNQPYLAFQPQPHLKTRKEISQEFLLNRSTHSVMPNTRVKKLSAYPAHHLKDLQEEGDTRNSLAIVRTVQNSPTRSANSFVDHMGVMAWESLPRQFETIEVSIKFEEEEEENRQRPRK